VVDLLIKPPPEVAHQLTAYDTIYVAMAGATLLTRDARLARAAGHRARVELV
jgi:predicted nucleic acid-binding protein